MPVTNILSVDDVDTFFRVALRRAAAGRHYGGLSRLSLALPSPAFLLYVTIAHLANFKTRIADLAWRRRMLRSWRSPRQQRRILASLQPRFIESYGRQRYGIRGRTTYLRGAAIRPIRAGLLHLVTDDRSALLTRWILWLAWWRGPWTDIRLQTVRDGLRIDRGTAAVLYKWLRRCGLQRGKAALRRAVFWSTRPMWQYWRAVRARTGSLFLPRKRLQSYHTEDRAYGKTGPPGRGPGPPRSESDRVTPAAQSFEKLEKLLTSTGLPAGVHKRGGRARGTMPTSATGTRTAAPRVDPPRAIDSDLRPRPNSAAADSPRRGRGMERGDRSGRSCQAVTVDQLIAAMPQQQRDRFRQSFGVKARRYLEACKQQQMDRSREF
jgi:hypothetical protein